MSRGRPNNSSKGTSRPDESRAPEPSAGKTGAGQPTSSAATSGQPTSSGQPGSSQPTSLSKPSTPSTDAGGPAVGSKPSMTPLSAAAPASATAAAPSPGATTGGSGAASAAGGTTRPGSAGTSSTGGSTGRAQPPSPPPPAAKPGRSGTYVAGVVGGVVGAVLAVIGAPLVQGPPPLAPEPASRLATVESNTASLETAVADLQSLAENLEPTVRGAVEAAVAEVPSRDAQAIATFDERVDTVSSQVTALTEAAAAATDPLPLIEAQGGQLAALQATLDSLASRLTIESERLDAARVEASGALAQEIGAAGERLDLLTADVATQVAAASAAASSELAAAQAATAEEIAGVRSEVETALAEIGAIQQTIQDMQQARSRAAAAALLVRDIDQTIEVGGPFAEPLDRLLQMAGDDSALQAMLAELQPYAAEGVPSIGSLRDDLAVLAATRPTSAVAGSEWLGQTVENITGLVSVRDKDSETDIATGQLEDADQALRNGDLELAITLVEEAAAAADGVDPAMAASWVEKVRARQSAVAAQAQLDAQIRELLTATVN